MEQEITSQATFALLDNLQEGILVVDPNGTLLHVNPTAARLLGFDFDMETKPQTAQFLVG